MRPMHRTQPPHPGLSHRLLSILLFTAVAMPSSSWSGDGALDKLAEAIKPLTYALSLIGTPYRFGGTSPETGVDCSGLVRHVYAETAELRLPHSAAEISQQGEPIPPDQLKPGDLVFFNTMRRPFSHVGIYKGDGEFVHASSTRTGRVQVSDMNKHYWAKRFDGARRILP